MRPLLAGLALIAATAAAQDAQTLLHLLDYIGVDYAEAVEGGKVKNEDEYKEMLEFAARVAAQANNLAGNPAKAAIVRDAQALEKQVQDKAAPAAVAEKSRELRWSIVRAYKLANAPLAPPDLALGAKLYAQHCASCHGPQGRGDGPAGKGLEPAPSNFHDAERMAQRSAYGLYNTITLGVEGTAMTPFKQLSEAERWALAFHVGTMGSATERIADGERRWKSGEARSSFPSLDNVATLSAREVEARYGAAAVRVHDYLRAHPEAVKPAPVSFARQKIAEAAAAYAAGNVAAA
jgi:high-affinity iron transporter